MATDSLSYSGINRSITDYAGSRACEELINLRPTSEGLIPVRPFTVKFSNKPFIKFFVHHTKDGDKYIVLRAAGDGDDSVVYHVDADGYDVQWLFYAGGLAGDPAANAINFAAAGNVLLISMCDREDGSFENRAYTWKDGAYAEMEANVPALTLTMDDDGTVVKETQECAGIVHDSTEQDVTNAVESAVNAVQELNPELCLGAVIVATAFKTKDGNTFWTGNWKIYDPLLTIATTNPPYEDDTTLESADVAAAYEDFFDEHGHGYRITSKDLHLGVQNTIKRLEFYGTNVKLQIGALSSTPGASNYWNKDTSMIQSVEVYSSRPIYYFNTKSAFEGFRALDFGNYYMTILLTQSDYVEMDFDGQLMYHQASVPMESLLRGQQDVLLRFGGNLQVSNETLRVDAGAVTRYGKVISYNSRFHYFDSVSETTIGAVSFSGLHSDAYQSGTTYILARYSDENVNKLLYLGKITGTYGYGSADLTIAPSMNITEVILYYKYTGGGHAMYKDSVCRMRASSSYNYGIGYLADWQDTTGSGTKSEYENAIPSDDSKPDNVVYTAEPAAINVTEQYNPFVFRVEHSYLAQGNIIDLVPQNFVVTDATYGREPLDVFTTQGIYALIQGSGDILYSWFDHIDPMVAFGRAVPTEMGIFFLSGGCLYLCAGHRITLVSDALMAGPHKYVRSAGPNGAYAKIAGSSGAVDMSSFVSAAAFETFAAGARLSYNRFRQEVYVSNLSYAYTYVLSLKYRQWFKVSGKYWQDEPASPFILRPGSTSGNKDVLDMETESTGSIKVHLQTRPFSMGYQYAHIHRALSMIRAKLSTGDKAILHLYGSDDLQNWKLLAYASRSGSSSGLYISQLRTPTAARSWRYYTICLTGQVPSAGDFQTDVGPFVVDYSAVIRRIG